MRKYKVFPTGAEYWLKHKRKPETDSDEVEEEGQVIELDNEDDDDDFVLLDELDDLED